MQQLCFIGFMTLIYLGSRIFSIKKKGNCNRKKNGFNLFLLNLFSE